MDINKSYDEETLQDAQQSSITDLAAPVDSAQTQPTARRRAAQRLLRAEVRYTVALLAFGVLAVFAYFYSYFGWDLRAARALQSLAVPGLEALMRFISFFGNTWHPAALTAITTLLFLFFHRRSEAAALLLSAGGGAIINSLAKILIARPRPTPALVRVFRDIPTQSFPSGHVTFYVCYFGFLFFVAYALLPRATSVRRLALTLLLLPVLLVGFSRVYLGAHWPSDAIGAYLLSGVWLAFSLRIYRHWKERATFHAKSGGESTT